MSLVIEIGLLARGIELHGIGAVGLHPQQGGGKAGRRVAVENALLVQHGQMRQVDLVQHLEIGVELPVQARKK
jgi:hypothetical protein